MANNNQQNVDHDSNVMVIDNVDNSDSVATANQGESLAHDHSLVERPIVHSLADTLDDHLLSDRLTDLERERERLAAEVRRLNLSRDYDHHIRQQSAATVAVITSGNTPFNKYLTGLPFAKFYRRFKLWADAVEPDETKHIGLLASKLDDQAFDIMQIWITKTPTITLPQIVAKFMSTFPEPSVSQGSLLELYGRTQHIGESIEAYAANLRLQAVKLSVDFDSLIETFIKGLTNKNLQIPLITQKPPSFQAAVDLAILADRIQPESKVLAFNANSKSSKSNSTSSVTGIESCENMMHSLIQQLKSLQTSLAQRSTTNDSQGSRANDNNGARANKGPSANDHNSTRYRQPNNDRPPAKKRQVTSQDKCHHCKAVGEHLTKDCPAMVCDYCNRQGHVDAGCSLLKDDIAKNSVKPNFTLKSYHKKN